MDEVEEVDLEDETEAVEEKLLEDPITLEFPPPNRKDSVQP